MRQLGFGVWALVCALAACAPQSGSDPQAPLAPGAADPVELIGIWAVEDAAGAGNGVVRLAPGHLTLWADCGHMAGAWDANTAGMFVGHVGAWGQGCEPLPAPEWLSRAVAFRPGDADVALLDRDGEVTARLRPDATPPPAADVAPSEVAPPEVTDEIREHYALTPAPLPSGLTPADGAAFAGRWSPADRVSTAAFVELAPDGAWHGSDGCNAQAGRWVSGPGGLLLAVSGPSTLIGCDNVPVSDWLVVAARAGLDGGELVLMDAAGAEIARLRPGD